MNRPTGSSRLPDIVHDLFIDMTDEGRDEWMTPEQLLDYSEDHALNEYSERDYNIFKRWRDKNERAALAEAAQWVEGVTDGG